MVGNYKCDVATFVIYYYHLFMERAYSERCDLLTAPHDTTDAVIRPIG